MLVANNLIHSQKLHRSDMLVIQKILTYRPAGALTMNYVFFYQHITPMGFNLMIAVNPITSPKDAPSITSPKYKCPSGWRWRLSLPSPFRG
jgi:hypothetical protein